MIKIVDKTKCSGCTACMSVCPKKAITMKEDREGFLYPEIDKSKCINCGLCEKACPILNIKYKNLEKFPNAYLCYEKSIDLRINSASGGAFYSIAKSFLKKDKAVVIGAAYDDNWMVHHIVVDNVDELLKLQKSKYVQSRMEDVYVRTLDYLKNGYNVLFSGTACQIAGIKKVIPDKYKEKLYTIDVVCYGVPSPKVFDKYVKHQEKKYGKIKQMIIRDKKIYHSSYRVGYGILFTSGKKYFEPHGIDPMARLFYSHYCLRPICYKCPFKTIGRNSDITIGDCWYPDFYIKGFKDKYGITMTLVNTDKGEQLLNLSDSIVKYNIDSSEIIRINGGKIYSSAPIPCDRNNFFDDLNHNIDFEELANKYTKIKKDSFGYKVKFYLRDRNLIPRFIDSIKRNKSVKLRLKKEIPESAKKSIE